jgi:protein-tyrosine-phosphatase
MKILFVCYGNMARSQTAKALYNIFTGTNDAESAGIGVKDHHPEAKTVAEFEKMMVKQKPDFYSRARVIMNDRHGIDIGDSPRLPLTPEMLAEYDLVVNTAERSQTPDWLRGSNVIWWDIEDPAGLNREHTADMGKMVATYDAILPRVKKLIEIEESGGDFHELDDNIDKEEN